MFLFRQKDYKKSFWALGFALSLAVLLTAGSLSVCAAEPVQVIHHHTGDSVQGGGCYGTVKEQREPVCHEHSGSEISGGGCYTNPVGHSHTGSEAAGGGCYGSAVYHNHTGSGQEGNGCYTVPDYHAHTGSENSGGGCYTEAICHIHQGSEVKKGGCYSTPICHVHSGSEKTGGGCYTKEIYHSHSGSSGTEGGCYTTPVCHEHSGVEEVGGGCYTKAVYHSHSGSSGAKGGCYTMPEYHSHTGSSSGGGCYTVPVYHTHTGAKGDSPNGCYTKRETETVANFCGMFVENGEGRWFCDNCGEETPAYNVPYGRQHAPYSYYDVYVLGCGKTTGTVEYYKMGCGKTTDTIEGYKLNCGKTTDTVIRYELGCGKEQGAVEYYTLGCGKDEMTVEKYELNCGKTAETVEKYGLSCGKTTSTVEKYGLGCGKTEQTVEGYHPGCGKNELTIEKYALSCGKQQGAAEYYTLGCGKNEKTLESYRTIYQEQGGYELNCGMQEGEVLGLLWLTEEDGVLKVESEGIQIAGYLWSDGSTESSLKKESSETGYTCRVSCFDGHSVYEMELVSEEESSVLQPVKVELAKSMPQDSSETIETVSVQPLAASIVPLEETKQGKTQIPVAASAVLVSGVGVGILVLGIWFCRKKLAILYCYDQDRRYRLLGVLPVRKHQGRYRIQIHKNIRSRATMNRYRLAMGAGLWKSEERLQLQIDTGDQNLVLPIEEFVDFAL